MKRALPTLALAAAIAAICAPSASATADRAEYAAKVNPICIATNVETERLFDGYSNRVAEVQGEAGFRKSNRLLNKLLTKLLRVGVAELGLLRQVVPPPGDESLVTSWLGVREQELSLIKRINRLTSMSSRLFAQVIEGRRGAFEKFERRQNALQKKQRRVYEQYGTLYELDLELGTRLGASYCVTGATGVVTTTTVAGP